MLDDSTFVYLVTKSSRNERKVLSRSLSRSPSRLFIPGSMCECERYVEAIYDSKDVEKELGVIYDSKDVEKELGVMLCSGRLCVFYGDGGEWLKKIDVWNVGVVSECSKKIMREGRMRKVMFPEVKDGEVPM